MLRLKTFGMTLCVMMSAVLVAPPVLSQTVLKGGVQEEYLRLHPGGAPGSGRLDGGASTRISRAPAALQGSAVDSTAFAVPMTPQGAPLTGAVDSGEFAKLPKNFDIGADRGSREMSLAWERWHKQLSEVIYKRWQQVARDPGKATIKITVGRDRTIRAQVLNTAAGPEFMQTILMVIESLDGNPGLTFPAKSQRQQVSFEADYIAASNVRPGYSWVKGDVEKIKESW